MGLTLVAIGTSLPELVTAIQSARRGETALLAVLGSNVFNSTAVVGTAALVGPGRITDAGLTVIAAISMVCVAGVAGLFLGLGGRLRRPEAAFSSPYTPQRCSSSTEGRPVACTGHQFLPELCEPAPRLRQTGHQLAAAGGTVHHDVRSDHPRPTGDQQDPAGRARRPRRLCQGGLGRRPARELMPIMLNVAGRLAKYGA